MFIKFQYILCYGSTGAKDQNGLPIFKFQYILCYGSTQSASKFSLWNLNFNTSYVTVQRLMSGIEQQVNEFQYILCYGSTTFPLWKLSGNKFQYILCYGSTGKIATWRRSHLDFNTSYVTVQRVTHCNSLPICQFQYILCYGSTYVAVVCIRCRTWFQYILCYGSTIFVCF